MFLFILRLAAEWRMGMKMFSGNKYGRFIIIGLQKDDFLLESVQTAVDKYGIKNAIVTSGVAAVYHMRWHHIANNDDEPVDVIHEIDGPIEVGGITGMVVEGVPHLHCTFADHNRAWAGHLEEGCRIQYVGEISLIELLDVGVGRVANNYGVKLLTEKNS